LISSYVNKIKLAVVSNASKLSSGLHEALMKDKSSLAELEVYYEKIEIPVDSICWQKIFSEYQNSYIFQLHFYAIGG
jgi:hypothetical protein